MEINGVAHTFITAGDFETSVLTFVIPAGALERARRAGTQQLRTRRRRTSSALSGPAKLALMVGRDSFIAVYIMASRRNGTLYTGVTSALQARVSQHKLGVFEGFSKTYGCKALVWFETHSTMAEAIAREKQIKRWRRAWKLALIEAENPQWRDLSQAWFELPEGPLSWTPRP